nr:MAG TPA: hypothetical protein [Caudoviricetes sp.]
MAKWFETIVPNDRTWMSDLIRPVKELKKGGPQDISEYLSYVLTHTDDPGLDTDNFTAIVNIRNGFIPNNGNYSKFSIEIKGIVKGEEVDKTILGDSNPIGITYTWSVRKITFIVSGRNAQDKTKETVIDAGGDYIMRVDQAGNNVLGPGDGEGARYGAWWAKNAEFNPKITPAALASIKAALNKEPGTENL